MTKPEFLQRLSEDKFFDNPDELIEYRLPVIQWYLDNYNTITKPGFMSVWPLGIQIKRQDNDFVLINQAFESLKNRIGEF